jgi:large conductance mechanosensitive channel
MLKEFKEFALKGSVLDLAVGVIIGGAFGKITASLVGDVIMPPIGALLGKVDFSSMFIDLSGKGYASLAAAKAAGAPVIGYGAFLNTCIEFLIVALAIFLVVRGINKLHRQQEAEATTKTCPYCCSDVPRAATRCPACTSSLSEAAA